MSKTIRANKRSGAREAKALPAPFMTRKAQPHLQWLIAANPLLLQLELVPALLDLSRILEPPLAVGQPLYLLVLAIGRELVELVLGQQASRSGLGPG